MPTHLPSSNDEHRGRERRPALSLTRRTRTPYRNSLAASALLRRPYPNGYRRPLFLDTAFRKVITTKYASLLLRSQKVTNARRDADEQRRVLQFEDVNDEGDDAVSVYSGESAASTASARTHMNVGARRVWRKATMRSKQIEGVTKALFDESCGGKLLLVDRTGGGEVSPSR